jgi:hypothetical protein
LLEFLNPGLPLFSPLFETEGWWAFAVGDELGGTEDMGHGKGGAVEVKEGRTFEMMITNLLY